MANYIPGRGAHVSSHVPIIFLSFNSASLITFKGFLSLPHFQPCILWGCVLTQPYTYKGQRLVTDCLPQSLLCLIVSDIVSHRTWSIASWLDHLVGKSLRFTCLSTLITEVTVLPLLQCCGNPGVPCATKPSHLH